ncbi:three-helix bundle dimerization domain-containing protein [Nocardia otitidiscaviarum]|uniref:Protein-tyrosine-phosphatase-like N-terminal domain-containing protein n=1 Tax=Nocardia otitidiscaviarum TaxID=1823 RepID=A0A516NGJ6_9NOCA|nr:hypothetical protein [Nocardia otitidiscaviarum]MBF6177947.1 hypothetical protein [Nocardia otitidiscaviarum]MCP9623416.1 hypothetical protein [Nocardia otitidiscaviarum]QDP78029.1 hypothetical protein FOH10_04035 [Nocardia otitidiscaviarum]
MTQSPVDHAAHPRGDLPLDQKLALEAAAARLLREFGDHTDEHTIDHLLYSTYNRVARQAKVETFLPLLAERFTRERLQAMTTPG